MEILVPEIKGAKVNNFSLESYLKKPLAKNKKLEDIDTILKKKGGPEGKRAYSFEKEAIDKLRLERIQNTYPSLDLSFLGKSIDYPIHSEDKTYEYALPRFAVYSFFGKGKSEFTVREEEHGNSRGRRINFSDVPFAFQKELIGSSKYNKFAKPYQSYLGGWVFNSPEINGKDCPYKVELATEFHASIEDDKTIGNVNNALNFFKKNELYLIAERKAEDWEVKKIENDDPLIVGLWQDTEPFLIDIFDTTDLEKYVSDIYIEKKN